MSDEKIKKALDHLLGIESVKPDKEIEQAVVNFRQMNQAQKMSGEMKSRGWKEIQQKKLDYGRVKDQKVPAQKSKKIILFPLLSLATAAMVIIVASWVFNELIRPERLKAEIVASTGSVIVNGETAKLPLVVEENDVLESPAGNYRMIINNNIVLNVEYKSKLWFSQVDKDLIVNLEEGGIAAVVKKSQSPSYNDIHFNTPTGKVEVKGTIFYLRVISPEETYFCICHGHVVLEAGSSRIDAKASHHKGYSIVRSDSVSGKEEKIISDTMKYHQDPLLEEMANQINYKVSWDKE